MHKKLNFYCIGVLFFLSISIFYPGASEGSQTGGGDGISIEQAISDEAQRNTISFDGLAFLTGDLCGDSFLPPGKVADFSGFQYLRDTDPTNLGHNTDFVTIIAFNLLTLLTESQIASLVTLAENQIALIAEYGYDRFPLMKAFRRLLDEDLPTGSSGLNKSAVTAYSAELYRLDGEISYGRAKTLGGILRGMSATQKAKLDALKSLNGVGNWNKTLSNPLESLKLDKDLTVAVMTYASEMYSWYAGSVEADTYFCPERQGTYFGSFFMKDAPAMAAGPGFTIPSNLTADMGTQFLGTLTSAQAAIITNLVEVQRDTLYQIVETRRAISTELRKFIQTDAVDEKTVLSLAEKYGELDGTIVYHYAVAFTEVSETLTPEQTAAQTELRESWNTIPCSGAYLYSEKIAMPEIINTDFLFGVTASPVVTGTSPTKDTTPTWSWIGGGNGNFRYQLDGGTWNVTTQKSFTPVTALTVGNHTLVVQEKNAAGSWSLSGKKTILIDITPPSPPIVNGVSPTNDTTPTWRWTRGGGGNNYFRFKLDSGAWVETTQLTFTPTVALTAGPHTLQVQERDAAMNWSVSGKLSIMIDTTPPNAPIVTCATPATDTTPTWRWTRGGGGNNYFRFKLDGGAWVETTRLTFTPTVALTIGTHTLQVQERDAAMNWSRAGSNSKLITK